MRHARPPLSPESGRAAHSLLEATAQPAFSAYSSDMDADEHRTRSVKWQVSRVHGLGVWRFFGARAIAVI